MSITDTEILAALRHSQAPVGPSARRIAARDYPVQRPRPMLAAGVSATGLAAAGSGILLVLSGGASPAFAGWSATPTVASETQIAQAEAVCNRALASSQTEENERLQRPESQAEQEHNQASRPEEQTHDTAWQALLTDTRGPYTAFYLEGNEGDRGFCMIGPGSTPLAWVWKQERPEATVEAGAAKATEGGASYFPGEGEFQMLGGQVGDGVTAIVYHLSNGTNVSATVAEGRYLVWWPPQGTDRHPIPIAQEVASTTITNSDGSTTTASNGKSVLGNAF